MVTITKGMSERVVARFYVIKSVPVNAQLEAKRAELVKLWNVPATEIVSSCDRAGLGFKDRQSISLGQFRGTYSEI